MAERGVVQRRSRRALLPLVGVVLLALVGVVAFLPERPRAVSEWELVPPPPSVDSSVLRGVAAAFNPYLNGYFVWGVGSHVTADTTGVVLRYDRFSWQPATFSFDVGEPRRFEAVATYLEDLGPAGPSPEDTHHVWAVGEAQPSQGPGAVWYSQTSSTTGTATPWDRCIGAGVGCQPIVFENGTLTPGVLEGVDFFDRNTGLAVGAGCEVWRTDDGGVNWARQPNPPGCDPATNQLQAVRFARNYDLPADAVGNVLRTPQAWVVSTQSDTVWMTYDFGVSWVSFTTGVPSSDWFDVGSVFYGGNYHVWIGGKNGQLRYLTCTPVTCLVGPFPAFADGASGGTLGVGSVPVNAISAIVDTTLTPARYKVWAGVGAVGFDTGALLRSENPTDGPAAEWRRQSTTTPSAILGLDVVNPTHAWGVGDAAALLQLSPGNLNGFGWIGSDTCENLCPAGEAADLCASAGIVCQGGAVRNRPLGWLSLNCANGGVCQTNDFNYGVNLKQKREKPLVETACTDPDQDPDVGALSGFAWVGASDPAQESGGVSCAVDPSVCRPVGWLSFERLSFCTGDATQTCRTDADCAGVGTCDFAGSNPPGPPFNSTSPPYDTFQFRTSCQKDISDASQERYVQALYDYGSSRVEGWARFVGKDFIESGTGWVKLRGPYMCGTAYCSNDRSRTCADDSDCVVPGTCDTSAAGAAAQQSCPTLAANNSHYVRCTDCETNDAGTPNFPDDDYLTCGICTKANTDDWWDPAFSQRAQLTVQPPAGKSIIGQFHTISYRTDLESAVKFPGVVGTAPDYDSLRVIYQTATGNVELNREIVPLSNGQEEIRFRAYADIADGANDDRYYLYFDNAAPGPAPRNLQQVYWHFEDFSRDVFAGTSPLWKQTGPCAFTVTPGEMLRSGVPSAATDCIAYRDTFEMTDVMPSYQEAMIRLEAEGPFEPDHPQGSVGFFAFSGPNIDAGGWAGIVRHVDAPGAGTQEVFVRDNVEGAIGSVPATVDLNRWYRVKWQSEYLEQSPPPPPPDCSTQRLEQLWIDQMPGLLDAAPTLTAVDTCDHLRSASFPGVQTWNTDTSWDDYRFWYGYEGLSFTLAPAETYVPPSGGAVPLEPWACNQCGTTGGPSNSQCGVGRCIDSPEAPDPGKIGKVCLNNEQCGGPLTPSGNDSCQPSGRCSDTGEICWGTTPGGSPGFCDSTAGATCDGLGELVCNECSSCSLYGVSVDLNGGGIYGFGYSEDFGFIDFSHAFLYNRSWLQVLRGSIYSRSSVGSSVSGQAPGLTSPASRADQCNATFVIRSNGTITNFCSVQDPVESPSPDPTVSPFLNPEFRQLDLPTKEAGFASGEDLLRLDELLTDVGGGVNVFGQDLVDLSAVDKFSDIPGLSQCLGNTVFYRKSPTNTPFVFDLDWSEDATPFPLGYESCVAGGRGTFVFEGSDVRIDQNLGYDSFPSPASIDELASLGIILIPDRSAPNPPEVRLTIALPVTHTVGNFFVDGTIEVVGETSTSRVDQQYLNDGVMVAKAFEFNRRYRGTIDNPQPSEVIRNDGRLTLNPPPGFQGFAANLPLIRESRP